MLNQPNVPVLFLKVIEWVLPYQQWLFSSSRIKRNRYLVVGNYYLSHSLEAYVLFNLFYWMIIWYKPTTTKNEKFLQRHESLLVQSKANSDWKKKNPVARPKVVIRSLGSRIYTHEKQTAGIWKWWCVQVRNLFQGCANWKNFHKNLLRKTRFLCWKVVRGLVYVYISICMYISYTYSQTLNAWYIYLHLP